MSATLGAISSYAYTMQQIQLSVIKSNIEMQQKSIDILLNTEGNRNVSPAEHLGKNIDINV